MKIAIKSPQKSFTLRFPSFLIFNGLVASLCGSKFVSSILEKNSDGIQVKISSKDTRRLFKEIRKARRRYKNWYIVEVEDGNESVKIKLSKRLAFANLFLILCNF